MYKTIFSHIGKYKKQTILAPVTIIGEVFMEVTIPAVMAKIIDNGVKQGDIGYVARMGALMMLMALCSLAFGALAPVHAVHLSQHQFLQTIGRILDLRRKQALR